MWTCCSVRCFGEGELFLDSGESDVEKGKGAAVGSRNRFEELI